MLLNDKKKCNSQKICATKNAVQDFAQVGNQQETLSQKF